MVKTLTDRELKEKFQTLDRSQLENFLIQVVRQLEEYQDKELTEEDKISLEKIKTEKAILERKLNELERDTFLAAELGKTLLETKVDLEGKLAILEGQLEGKISRKETEELKKTLLSYEERQQEWNKEEQKLKVEIRKIKQANNKIKKDNDNLIEEAKNIGLKNEKLNNEKEELKEKIKKQQKEIKDNEAVWKYDSEKIIELNESLIEEKVLRAKDNKKWEKKEELMEERIAKFRELEQQYNKLIKVNDKLTENNLLLKGKVEYLSHENTELQEQIEYNNEQRNNEPLIENSASPNKGNSLEEEIKKAEELKIIQKQNVLLNNQLVEARSQLAEVQAKNKENYWEREIDKKTQEKIIQKLIKETEKLEQEKVQSESVGISKNKKIESLQKEITENINFISSLHKKFRQAEIDWRGKLSSINDNLRQTQERLTSVISKQEQTEQELETRTHERGEARQAFQESEANLETNQSKSNELNKQIDQLQEEIAVVQQKLKEVEADRNEHSQNIKSHHEEEITKLEKERNELVKKMKN